MLAARVRPKTRKTRPDPEPEPSWWKSPTTRSTSAVTISTSCTRYVDGAIQVGRTVKRTFQKRTDTRTPPDDRVNTTRRAVCASRDTGTHARKQARRITRRSVKDTTPHQKASQSQTRHNDFFRPRTASPRPYGWYQARHSCAQLSPHGAPPLFAHRLRAVCTSPLQNVEDFTFEPSAERVDVGLRSRGPQYS